MLGQMFKTRIETPSAPNGNHAESANHLITLRDVVKSYKTPVGDFTALRGIDPVSYTHLTLPTIYSV